MYRHFSATSSSMSTIVHTTSPLRHEPCTSSTSTIAWEAWEPPTSTPLGHSAPTTSTWPGPRSTWTRYCPNHGDSLGH
jgi:hypothetical protein